jgi:hypothetical protein
MKDVIDYLKAEANRLDHFASFPQDKYPDEKHQIDVLVQIAKNSAKLAKEYDKAIKILNEAERAAGN